MQQTAQVSPRKAFYRNMCVLSIPIILQNLINAAVNSADTVMLGFVSKEALSASSLANQVYFILTIVFYGLISGASMLTAQYWGKGDKVTIERVIGIALRFSIAAGAVFACVTWCAPEMLMRIYTSEEPIIREGVEYLRIIAITYVLSGFSMAYLNIMRSVERVMLSTVTYFISLGLNVLLNAAFIFGWFGEPMGLRGVAIATVIARCVEVCICLVDASTNKVARVRLKYILDFKGSKVLMKDFLRFALPTMGNEIVWSVGFSAYSAILGHMGSDAVAANSVVSVARNLGSCVCFGISNATAVMLGKAMGQNRLEEAEVDAKRSLILSLVTGALGGGVILLCGPVLVRFMPALSGKALEYLNFMLWINAYYVIGQAMNTTFICGIFRAGGDAKFGFYCDIIDMWVFSIPLGILAAFVLKLSVQWVYFLICLDEFVKMPFVFHRYRSKKWLANITRDNLEA